MKSMLSNFYTVTSGSFMKTLKNMILIVSVVTGSGIFAMEDLRSLHPNMSKIAQGLLAQEDTITPRKLISFFESLPYTANALDVADRMKGKSHLVQEPAVIKWCANARKRLKHGELLRKHCWMPTETKKIDLLLKRKNLDLNGQDDVLGMTPLYVATFNRYTPLALRLTSMGANSAIADKGIKCTPLWLASTSGNHELVRALLDAGAEIGECDIPHLKYLGYTLAAEVLENEEVKRKAPAGIQEEPARKKRR